MNMDPTSLAVAIGAGTTALAGMWWVGRGLARLAKAVADLVDDWRGEPARLGVPARPGLMQRVATQENDIAAIKKELTLNGGKSLKDTVVRMSRQLDAMAANAQQPPVTVNNYSAVPVDINPPTTTTSRGEPS